MGDIYPSQSSVPQMCIMRVIILCGACVHVPHVCVRVCMCAQTQGAGRGKNNFCQFRAHTGSERNQTAHCKYCSNRRTAPRNRQDSMRSGRLALNPSQTVEILRHEARTSQTLAQCIVFAVWRNEKNAPIGEQWADWTRCAHPISSRFVLFFTSVLICVVLVFSLSVSRFQSAQTFMYGLTMRTNSATASLMADFGCCSWGSS